MAGILNETIVKFFENETDDDLTSNFVCWCFPLKLCDQIYFVS